MTSNAIPAARNNSARRGEADANINFTRQCYPRRVEPVQRFMPDALAAILRKAPLSPEKIEFAWRSAVGSSVDKVTTIELKARVLHVRAKDPAWRREIERSAGTIRSRLNALLGDGAVAGLNVTL